MAGATGWTALEPIRAGANRSCEAPVAASGPAKASTAVTLADAGSPAAAEIVVCMHVPTTGASACAWIADANRSSVGVVKVAGTVISWSVSWSVPFWAQPWMTTIATTAVDHRPVRNGATAIKTARATDNTNNDESPALTGGAFTMQDWYNARMEKPLPTLEELQAEAASYVRGLQAKNDGATLITLSGELGAGKTSYAQGVAKAFGVIDHVTSPTFVLEKVYALVGKPGGFSRLVHIDAYRLKGGEELGPLGFDELMQDTGNLILLEWPERVADALPAPAVRITLKVEGEGRTISYG